MEVLPQCVFKIIRSIILIMQNAVLRNASPDPCAKKVILLHTFVEYVGTGKHAIRRHVGLNVGEYTTFFLDAYRYAMQEIVHA